MEKFSARTEKKKKTMKILIIKMKHASVSLFLWLTIQNIESIPNYCNLINKYNDHQSTAKPDTKETIREIKSRNHERGHIQSAVNRLLFVYNYTAAKTNCLCPCWRLGRRLITQKWMLLPVSTLLRGGTGMLKKF